jgi:dolichyl-diphosphooligosaccharide--protein glycosyltransferase
VVWFLVSKLTVIGKLARRYHISMFRVEIVLPHACYLQTIQFFSFREVFRTKYGKVRIYKIMSVSKESRQWVEDNKKCDAPGSWFCPGHYPPALEKILHEKKDFRQLEDFNVQGGDEEYQEYQKQYFENLNNKGGSSSGKKLDGKQKLSKLSSDKIERINEDWGDSEYSSMMWEVISQGDIREFVGLVREHPEVAHVRSLDGRGPMWWAHEYKRPKMIELLRQVGVSETRKDANGIRPTDLSK